MKGGKSLTPEQQERVRAALQDMYQRTGSQLDLAKLLGVAQQTVSAVMAGASPGVRMAVQIALIKGLSYEELVNGVAPRIADLRQLRTFGHLPGWTEAAASVSRRVPAFAVLEVSTWPAPFSVAAVEPGMVFDLAQLFLKYAPEQSLEDAQGNPLFSLTEKGKELARAKAGEPPKKKPGG